MPAVIRPSCCRGSAAAARELFLTAEVFMPSGRARSDWSAASWPPTRWTTCAERTRRRAAGPEAQATVKRLIPAVGTTRTAPAPTPSAPGRREGGAGAGQEYVGSSKPQAALGRGGGAARAAGDVGAGGDVGGPRAKVPAATPTAAAAMADRPMGTVLIANRGEIARRIIHAAHQLGLRAACVASDADRDAVWHRSADVVVPLEGSTATETYLRADLILDAAKRVGADAVHPGYGFLSERASFAEACEAAGIAFVGPTADAMRRMGARPAVELARSVGVPTVPGVSGVGLGADDLAAAAARIGFPVLIKASAGGGGRGMRRVDEADASRRWRPPRRSRRRRSATTPCFSSATSRAPAIEVQVLGDGRGKVIHLFERTARRSGATRRSSRRRPRPPSRRAARRDHRCRRHAGRGGSTACFAGTAEFLVTRHPPPGGFYFLEMNTRLQVEHPVSEFVTGLDLAAWQLRLAGGEVDARSIGRDAARPRDRGAPVRRGSRRRLPALDRPPGRLPLPDRPGAADDGGRGQRDHAALRRDDRQDHRRRRRPRRGRRAPLAAVRNDRPGRDDEPGLPAGDPGPPRPSAPATSTRASWTSTWPAERAAPAAGDDAVWPAGGGAGGAGGAGRRIARGRGAR
ncbi:MAG: biotin carboxylase N-terminal domain-containing protein [Anaerolineae bacterium]